MLLAPVRFVHSIKNESASSLGFLGKRAENINELQYTKLEIRKEIREENSKIVFLRLNYIFGLKFWIV